MGDVFFNPLVRCQLCHAEGAFNVEDQYLCVACLHAACNLTTSEDHMHCDDTEPDRDALIAALETEIRDLRDALQPFAEACFGLNPYDRDGHVVFQSMAGSISAGDLRRAFHIHTEGDPE